MTTVTVDGVVYEKASTLAKRFKYTTDYIGQLCRAKKVDAQLIGRSWYVNPESLESHKESRYGEKANDSDTKISKIKITKDTNNQSSKLKAAALKAKAVKPKISLSPVVKAAVATKTSTDPTSIAIRKIVTKPTPVVAAQTFRPRSTQVPVLEAKPKTNQLDKKQHVTVDTFGAQARSKITSLETNFASRLTEVRAKYEIDETNLFPLTKKSPQALEVELAEAEKLKVKSLAKPTKLVADELPKIALKGDLTITSLNEILPTEEESEVKDNGLINKALSSERAEETVVKVKVGQPKILAKTTKIPVKKDKNSSIDRELETDETEVLAFTNYKKTPVLKGKDELDLALPELDYPAKSLSVSLTPQSIKIAEINHTKDNRLKTVAWITATFLAVVLLALFVVESSVATKGAETSTSLKFSTSGWREFLVAFSN